MSKTRKNFKKGVASFYIVAFSTLIMMIIAISFATMIISEITRTANDDLSQSAYDSALAGVEDAKLAYNNYQNCLDNSGDARCAEIIETIQNIENQDCDMVGKILGRGTGAVAIEESNVGNSMVQYYTCVKIENSLSDYRATLSSADLMRVINVKLDGGVSADSVGRVRISWYSDTDASNLAVTEDTFRNTKDLGTSAIFPSVINGVSVPPTISLALVQAGPEFDMQSFDTRVGNETNRGMIYLVPTNNYDAGVNAIGADAFLKSNDKTVENLPYLVYCQSPSTTDAEFACSATVDLPKPVGGERGDDSFMFVVSLPYGKPSTEFALELFCARDGQLNECYRKQVLNSDNTVGEVMTSQVNLKGVQVQVDSTGRANDLYRRVEVRMENMGNYSAATMGPLELLGTGADTFRKNYTVLCEYNFAHTCD